jgi:hypothetical protein
MPTPRLPDSDLIHALNLEEEFGSAYLAAKAGCGIDPGTLSHRIKSAKIAGLKPTFRKEAPRIHARQRLGKMHIVIPDGQVKDGVNTDHWEWIGNYIAEKKPDNIINIGDFWDMPSLSLYDKGKLPFEGRRYVKDIKAGRDAMERLLKPIDDYNRTAARGQRYEPQMDFTEGNHEHRITRAVDNNPEFHGKLDILDLGVEEFGWTFHPFLKVIKRDGIDYAHYFISGVMGRPVSSAAVLLRERQCSATMGHVQHMDIAIHKKTLQTALFCATCYSHDEHYLGPQGNSQKRGIIVKHEVEDGRYDIMTVSLNYLKKAYS